MNTVEIYAASLNKDQIITAVNDILPRAQACIDSDRGTFEYKLKSFKKRLGLIDNFLLRIFFLQMCNIIIIIIVISLKQSLPNAYAWSNKTKIQGTIQHGL